jgi:hypothetical protein
VEEGQEPTKRRECAGDVGTPENQAEEQKIDLLKFDSSSFDEVSAMMTLGKP